ncbi:MAG: PilZ domain-containing protein, partial [Bdellovibrionales bacterium]|nr:PilZ domain-containing protein [Bdellovibrionales bacterium]
CSIKDPDSFKLEQPDMLVFNFSFDDERYFFSGLIKQVEDKYIINLHSDLFYLQRRKSARMEIPDDYPSKAKVISFNGKPISFELKVLDFSSGGCRLSFLSIDPMIIFEDKFRTLITLGNRSSFEVDVQVRHVKPINSIKDLPQIMGVQFISKEPAFEGKMLNLYMDVQREIFLKYYKK